MIKQTKQSIFGSTARGDQYTKRNPQSVEELDNLYKNQYGVTRRKMNQDFLGNFKKDTKILEVGANIGRQLELLKRMGFTNLIGIEINNFAVRKAKRIHPSVDVIKGTAFDLPFKDNYFDLIFTSGLLIHIAPKDLKKAMSEIVRVSKKHVWGLEYYADKAADVIYRSNIGFLWKRDFADFYIKNFPALNLDKEKKYEMKNGNVSQMFLLNKKQNV
jgi:pseudaminic acid biosynthesis-associated methylase